MHLTIHEMIQTNFDSGEHAWIEITFSSGESVTVRGDEFAETYYRRPRLYARLNKDVNGQEIKL